MRVAGLDRIEIMVMDMDRALEFFAGKLGMEFKELERGVSERDGVRCYVCHQTHLHLISPILPLPDNAAPPMRKMVELLEKSEALFIALSFKVEDAAKAEAELVQEGIGIQHRYPASHDYASIGMDDFAQAVAREEDTLGLLLSFASYHQ